jgi:hypothetical protein
VVNIGNLPPTSMPSKRIETDLKHNGLLIVDLVLENLITGGLRHTSKSLELGGEVFFVGTPHYR